MPAMSAGSCQGWCCCQYNPTACQPCPWPRLPPPSPTTMIMASRSLCSQARSLTQFSPKRGFSLLASLMSSTGRHSALLLISCAAGGGVTPRVVAVLSARKAELSAVLDACSGPGMSQQETCAAQLLRAACLLRATASQCRSIIRCRYAHISEGSSPYQGYIIGGRHEPG